MKQLKIGVIGFRGETVDIQEAKENLALAFNTIEREHPDAEFVVFFDLLNLGISTIVPILAQRRGWPVRCILRIFDRRDWEKYGPVGLGSVIDKSHRYGDVILEMVDVLVRVGGGQKRQEWAQKFREMGKRTYEYDLTSG